MEKKYLRKILFADFDNENIPSRQHIGKYQIAAAGHNKKRRLY